nr:uncharacterized protein LOC111418257 isoform X2 [Onthophagus taurus]
MEIFGSPLRTPFTFPRTPSTQTNPPGNSFLPIPSFPVSAFPASSLLHHPINFDYRNTFLNFTATQERIPQAHELFAPAIIKTPAATKGQIKAYMKALQEEAQEELKEQMKLQGQQQEQRGYLVSDLLESKAVSYVNVKLGGMQNIKYHYLA